MTDDHPKPLEAVGDEALEARIVAWVLGEASPFEAAELEQRCADDPEAALFARRIRMLDGLVRDPGGGAERLPEGKRNQVLEALGGLAEPVPEPTVRLAPPKRDWRGAILRKLPAIAAVLVLLVIIGGLSAPMVLRQRKSAAGFDRSIAFYRESDEEMVSLMEVAEASADGKPVLPRELIEGTPRPLILPERTPFSNRAREVQGIVTGGLRSGDAAITRNSIDAVLNRPPAPPASEPVEGALSQRMPAKPSAPSSSVARTIASNTAAPGPIPVPEIEVREVTAALGDGDDFGAGWGRAAGAPGTTRESPVVEDLPMLGRLFDQRREGGAVVSGEGAAIEKKAEADFDGFANLGAPVLGPDGIDEPAADPFAAPVDRMNKGGDDHTAYDQTRAKLLAEVDAAWEIDGDRRERDLGEIRKELEDPAISDAKKMRLYREWREGNERLQVPDESKRMDSEQDEAVTAGIARYGFEDAKSDFETSQSLLEQLKVKLVGEEMQRRVSEDPVVVHQDATVEGPGLLSLDRRSKGRAVVQVRPSEPSVEVLPGYVAEGSKANSATFLPTEFEVVKARKTLKKAIELGQLKERTGKSEEQLLKELEKNLEVRQFEGTNLIEIQFKDWNEDLTREVVEAVTGAYRQRRNELEMQRTERALEELKEAVRSQEDLVEEKRKVLTQMIRNEGVIYQRKDTSQEGPAIRQSAPERQREALDLMAEVVASEEPFSTFSLHVSDASFKLAVAALNRGERPEAAGIRPEEFYNAFDYGDPAPSDGQPVACTLEQAAHPAFPQRNLLRIAVRTGSAGRAQAVPLNLTLLLDNSGSMERSDRSEGVARAVEQLATLLQSGDTVTVAGFSRTPRLLADRLDGARAAELNEIVRQVPAEGGTNLEQALELGGELAARQFAGGAQNRVVLFTDGAANLGDADPESLNRRVEALRQNGIAFDAAGFGADGLNDRLLERLTRNGNGRYYIVDDPAEADEGFAGKLAGAFRPAAENVKVQVVFNPERVGRYKLIGFEEHRLKKEDFRDDTVDAAEMAAEEAGVALYQMQVLPEGRGEVGEVRVRFRDAASGEMVERHWTIPYEPDAPAFDQAAESLQLAALAAFAAETLREAPMSGLVDFKELAPTIGRVSARYAESRRVAELRQVMDLFLDR